MHSLGTVDEPALPRWGRLAMAATGILGTGTFLIVNFSNLPLYGDSLDSFARWAPSHQTDAQHSIGWLLLTYLLYMTFAVYVTCVVGGRGGWSELMVRIAMTAVAARVAIEVTQLTFLTVASSALLTSGPVQVDFGGALGMFARQLAVTSLIPHMIFLGAVGAAMLAGRTLPVWLAAVTLAAAAIQAWAFLAVTVRLPVGPLGAVWYASLPLWPLVAGVTLFVLGLSKGDGRRRWTTAGVVTEPSR